MLKINKKVVLIFILSLLVLLEGLNPFFVLAKTSNDLNVNVEELQDGKVYLGELNLSVKNIKENGQIIIPKEYFNINNEELKKLEEELIDDNTLEDEENIRAKKEKKFIEEDENNFILNISNDDLILKLEAIKKGDTFIEVKDISQYEKVDLQVGDSFINDSDNISDPSSENTDNSTLSEEDAENENDKNDGNSSDVVDDTTDYVEQEEPMDNIVITEEPIEVAGEKFKVENINNSEDEINNFSKNIVTNYEMYCSDPDSKLEDGDITIDISIVSDSGKRIASINNFTKKSEANRIIKSSTDRNGRVSYVLNKPTPGNRYVFSVQTSAMSIAEKGDSYRIKLDFNIKGNEREYFSKPILINFENEDSDIITEENSKWTMNFKDGETLKLNRGGEGAKWYHIKNGGNQSFENLKIKYEYKDEKSISRLTAYTSADGVFSMHDKKGTQSFRDIEVEESNNGLTFVSTVGAINGNIMDRINITARHYVFKDDNVGDVFSVKISIYDGDRLIIPPRTLNLEVAEDTFEFDYTTNITKGNRGRKFSKGEEFAYIQTLKVTGPDDGIKPSNATIEMEIPNSADLKSVYNTNYHNGRRKQIKNIKIFNGDVDIAEGNVTITKDPISADHGKFIIDENLKVTKIILELGEIEPIEVLQPITLIFKINDNAGSSVVFKESILKYILNGESYEKSFLKNSLQISDKSEIKNKILTYQNYATGNVNGDAFNNGDIIKNKVSIGIFEGKMKNPYFFAKIPKGMDYKILKNVVQSPYNNNIGYASIPTFGKNTNEIIKCTNIKKYSLDDNYDLVKFQIDGELTPKNVVEMFFLEIEYQFKNTRAAQYEIITGFGFDEDDYSIEVLESDDKSGVFLKEPLPLDIKNTLNVKGDSILARRTQVRVIAGDIIDTDITFKNSKDTKWTSAGAENRPVNVYPGEKVDYKIKIKNNGSNTIKNLDLVNILPFEGDLLADNKTTRRSKFPLYIGYEKPKVLLNGKEESNVILQMSDSTNPKRFTVPEGIDIDGAEWTSDFFNIDKVRSVRIKTHSNLEFYPGDEIELSYTVNVPFNAPILANSIANNNIIYRYSCIKEKSIKASESVIATVKTKNPPNIRSIKGESFVDLNNNGIKDTSDIGKGNILVEFWKKENNNYVKTKYIAESTLVGNTAEFGAYDLPNGIYKLKVDIPNYYVRRGLNVRAENIDKDGFLKDNNGKSEISVNNNNISNVFIPLIQEITLSGRLLFVKEDGEKLTNIPNIGEKTITLEDKKTKILKEDENVYFFSYDEISEYIGKEVSLSLKLKDGIKILSENLKIKLNPTKDNILDIEITDSIKPKLNIQRDENINEEKYNKIILNFTENETRLKYRYKIYADGVEKTALSGEFYPGELNKSVDITVPVNKYLDQTEENLTIFIEYMDEASRVISLEENLNVGKKPIITVEKKEYEVYANSNIEDLLSEIRKNIKTSDNRDTKITYNGSLLTNEILKTQGIYELLVEDNSSVGTKADPVKIKLIVKSKINLDKKDFEVHINSSIESLTSEIQKYLSTNPSNLKVKINLENVKLNENGEYIGTIEGISDSSVKAESVSFKVKVINNSYEIKDITEKLEFNVLDKITEADILSKITVMVSKNKETPYKVSENLSINIPEDITNTSGIKTLTLTYEVEGMKITKDFTIFVKDSYEIKVLGNLEYFVGEKDNIEIEVLKNNKAYTPKDSELKVEGLKNLTDTSGKKIVNITLTIDEKVVATKKIEVVVIDNAYTLKEVKDQEYKVNEELNNEKVIEKANLEILQNGKVNNEVKITKKELILENDEKLSSESKKEYIASIKVTVEYKNETKEVLSNKFKINILNNSYEIKDITEKLEFNVLDKITEADILSKITVMVSKNKETPYKVSENLSINIPEDITNTSGTKTLTLTYEVEGMKITKNFTIFVKDSYEIKVLGNLEYFVGEKDNIEIEVLKNNKAYTPKDSELKVEGLKNLTDTSGKKTVNITLTIDEKVVATKKIEVVVIDNVYTLKQNNIPKYNKDEKININKLVKDLELEFTKNGREYILSKDYEIKVEGLKDLTSVAGEKEIKIILVNKEETLVEGLVKVKVIDSIYKLNSNDKLKYNEGIKLTKEKILDDLNISILKNNKDLTKDYLDKLEIKVINKDIDIKDIGKNPGIYNLKLVLKISSDNILEKSFEIEILKDKTTSSKSNKIRIKLSLVDKEKVDKIDYIKGYEDKTLKPNNLITREEAATIIYRLLSEEYKKDNETIDKLFKDIDNKSWSSESINTLAKANILTGYPDGTFKPKENITRAEISKIIYSIVELEKNNKKSSFTDIENSWAKKYIISLENLDILTGYEDNTFRPDIAITRAEFITIINRVLGKNATKPDIENFVNPFTDVSKSKWYYSEVVAALKK